MIISFFLKLCPVIHSTDVSTLQFAFYESYDEPWRLMLSMICSGSYLDPKNVTLTFILLLYNLTINADDLIFITGTVRLLFIGPIRAESP